MEEPKFIIECMKRHQRKTLFVYPEQIDSWSVEASDLDLLNNTNPNPIVVNFGNSGGYGVCEIRCNCGNTILGENVTPREAIDLIESWLRE